MPKVSIIIPVYQNAAEIPACLNSILAQTFQDFEIIVVNDGSTDNLLEVLEKYEDKITLINQENQGSNVARNRGVREAKGEYLIFCDADIVFVPQTLEKMVKVLDSRPDISYVYSSFIWGEKKFKLWEFNPKKLKEMNYIHTTSLLRKKDFPGFDEKIKRLQDWDLWLTMLAQGKKGFWLPEYLFQVKPRRGGMSSWFPKFFLKTPLLKKLPRVKKYRQAVEVIKRKHRL